MDTVQNVTAYLIQIGLIAAIAELLMRLVPVAAAGFRYAYWRVVLGGALTLPWIWRGTANVPSLAPFQPVTAPVSTAASQLPAAAVIETSSAVEWTAMLPWMLAAGVIARMCWVGIGMLRLRALRRSGDTVIDPLYEDVQQTLRTRADIREVAGLAQPVTFGVLRPVVLLPRDLSMPPDIRRAIVAHELVHVRRRDWAWVLAEEALRAGFWFHPAVWWLTSRIRLAREEFTDHLAVLATGSRRTYIEALLAFSDRAHLDPAPAFARRGHLFHRIVMLSKEAAMSSERIVCSGAALALLFAAGAWYASDTFPIIKAPVVEAATPGRDVQLAAIPRVRVPVPVRRPPAAAPAQAQAAQSAANRVTPENPIPRRLFSVPIPYPSELAGTNFAAGLEMEVVLNAGGSVASVRRTTIGAGPEHNGRPIMDVFNETAVRAIQQWQYDPPAKPPLQFYVSVTFRPGQDATIVQSDTARAFGVVGGVVAGRAVGRAAGPAGVVPPPPPPPPAPGTMAPIRVGGQIRAPQQLRKVDPSYPPIAQSARVQGVVILEVVIDEQGRVTDAKILRSIPLLDQAAIDAVSQWEYEPTRLNGQPVPIIMTVTVQFTLPDVSR